MEDAKKLVRLMGVPVVDCQLLFGDHRHSVAGERWFPEQDDAQGFSPDRFSSHATFVGMLRVRKGCPAWFGMSELSGGNR